MGKFKIKLCFLVIIMVALLKIWTISWSSEYSVNISYEPSYIVAVRGNDVPLYAAVSGILQAATESYIYSNEHTKQVAADLLKNIPTKREVPNPIESYLNLHLWNEICHLDLDNLIHYPLFPSLPTSKSKLYQLTLNQIDIQTGARIFGYLLSKKTTSYHLKAEFYNCAAQVWFSTDNKPENSKLLFDTNNSKIKNEYPIYLKKEKQYFIDIILKTSISEGSFSLRLTSVKQSQSKDDNMPIRMSPYYQENNEKLVDLDYNVDDNLLPMLQNKLNLSKLYDTQKSYDRFSSFTIPFMSQVEADGIFPYCDYKPSYTVAKKIHRLYQGVWETHLTSVYPNDQTNISYRLNSANAVQTIFGNQELHEMTAQSKAYAVFEAIQIKTKSKYSLISILNVEENVDPIKGKRYLIELKLSDNNDNGKIVRYSEYIYIEKDSNKICYPKDFKWNKTADVNFILTSGNQGRWVKYFIDTMERIYKETNDQNFNVIIVDFNSRDINLIQALKDSSLPRYILLKHTGNFHKTIAIQTATNVILDPNSIALQVDLHTTMPSDFVELARKHAVIGKMAWSPMLIRLQCGFSPQIPYGSWEISGYGIFGVYKSDWLKFGGMNVEKFMNKWGGEDWDLLDRVLNAGYEVERLKVKNFFHVFHSKKGMWHNMLTAR